MLKYRVQYIRDGRVQSVHFRHMESVNEYIAEFPEGQVCEIYEQGEKKIKTIKVTEEWRETWEAIKKQLKAQHAQGDKSGTKQIANENTTEAES